MTSIPRFAADASAHDVAGALTTAGAAIIERLVPGSLVDELLGQMHPLIEATPFGGDDFVGRRTKRTGALLRVTGDGSGSDVAGAAGAAGGSAPASFGGADGVRPNIGR
jgi:hypothetical protein